MSKIRYAENLVVGVVSGKWEELENADSSRVLKVVCLYLSKSSSKRSCDVAVHIQITEVLSILRVERWY